MSGAVTIRTFWGLPEALVCASFLEANGTAICGYCNRDE